MSSQSPSSVLYSSDGTELAVVQNTSIPVGTRAILVDGSSSDGFARTLLTDTSGRLFVNQGTPNILTEAWPVTMTDGYGNILGDPSNPLSVSGTIMVSNLSVGATGASPPSNATYTGALVTTAMESGLTNGDMYPLNLTTTGLLRIDGAYPSGTATATAVDMSQVGGLATTAAPTYTTATLNPLSLTTSGLLRVDGTGGVFNSTAVSSVGSAAPSLATYVAGLTATAAPTYATGLMEALSLTLNGQLRIDSAYPTGTATASAPDMAQVGGIATTAAPTYTTGTVNAFSMDTSGNLRVAAVTNKSTAATITSVTVTANAATSLLAANASRVFATIYNNTNKNMYIALGSTANATTNFSILLITGSYWEVPSDWTGSVNEFSPNGASGNCLVTELS
jgi:hypothetical protein